MLVIDSNAGAVVAYKLYNPLHHVYFIICRYWRCDIQGAPTGKLAGKTVGIKDNIAVAGVPMMNGTKLLEGYTPEFDATVVTRILDAGIVILTHNLIRHLRRFNSLVIGSSYTRSA